MRHHRVWSFLWNGRLRSFLRAFTRLPLRCQKIDSPALFTTGKFSVGIGDKSSTALLASKLFLHFAGCLLSTCEFGDPDHRVGFTALGRRSTHPLIYFPETDPLPRRPRQPSPLALIQSAHTPIADASSTHQRLPGIRQSL